MTGLVLTVLSIFIHPSCSPAQNQVEVTLTEGTNIAVSVSPDQSDLVLALHGTLWHLDAKGGTAHALTDHLADAYEPAWSPDGDRIAFHSYRDGNFHIWVMNRNGENIQQITDGYFDDREPHWTPDGESLVFSSDRSGFHEIWKVDMDSGRLTQLTFDKASNYNPAVSPDGTRIVYVSDSRENPGIYLLDSDGPKLIYASRMRLAAPSWNRSGTKVLFTAYTNGNMGYCTIYCRASYQILLDPVSGVSEILSSDEDLFPFRASWSSDTRFIYTADGVIKERSIESRSIGLPDTRIIPFEAGITLQRPSYKRRKHDFDNPGAQKSLGISGPVVSPDGKKIAFAALGDLYIQEIGGGVVQLTDDEYVELDPDWSPDGRYIAYISDRSGRMQIWIRDLATNEERVLVPDFDGEAAMPSWSPDGRSIAFMTADYRKKWGSGSLLVADVNSGTFEVKHGAVFVPSKPSWSPDGKIISLMALHRFSPRFREGHNRFLLIELESGESRFVTPDESRALSMRNQNGPVWSPDGRKIAYVQDGTLWMVPVSMDGSIVGTPEQLTDHLADNISWTGDSKHLVYLSVDILKMLNVDDRSSIDIDLSLAWNEKKYEGKYIIQAGRVFTGDQQEYLVNVDLIIEGNRIVGIEERKERSGIVIDARDKVVMPGLFEMHSHQSSGNGRMLGRLWLAYGITSVRDPGSDPYDSLYRKESWASNRIPGPRLFFTGGLMDGRPSYGLTHSILSQAHLEMEMDRARILGYDFIKTYVRFPDYLQDQVIQHAHKMGIPVTSHEIYPAARNNSDSIEHDRATSRRGYAFTQSDLSNTYEDVIQLLNTAGMSMTPTLTTTGSSFAKMVQSHRELINDPRLFAFHSDNYMRTVFSQVFNLDAEYRLKKKQEALMRFIKAGGMITAGTDSPLAFPYAVSLHAEIWTYVDAGMTPFQALQTATINAARAVGVADDLGSIRIGKVADLIIIDGDPLNRIQDSIRITTVIKNGIVFAVNDLINQLK